MNLSRKKICSLCISVALSGCGLCFIFIWPIVLDCALSLHCNPVMYHLWKNIPIDIKTEFYLFNWTNPSDVYNVSVKPKFEEMGPYSFIQQEEKTNIVWNDNGTVTFRQRRFWHYDDSENNNDLNDKITSIDPTALSVSYVTRNWNYYMRRGAFLTLSSYFSKIHSTHTVSELLFDGYTEPLIQVAQVMPFFDYLNLPKWDRFGWVYNRNGSTDFDGVFNMGTGRNSILGEMYHWNYKSHTGFFENECGKVQGSSTQFFPRNLKPEPLTMFSTDLGRTVSLKFAHENKIRGIVGYKFVAEDFMLDNGTIEPKNKCFCPGECLPSGLANISSSRHGSPLFVSLPHFYGTDPYYLSLVDGLKPDKEKHEFSVTIEPTTGMILEANAKIQINLLMQPVPGAGLFEDVPKVVIPVIWSQQKVQIPTREAFIIKILLIFPVTCVTTGIILILLSVTLLLYKFYTYRLLSHEKMKENIQQLEKLMK